VQISLFHAKHLLDHEIDASLRRRFDFKSGFKGGRITLSLTNSWKPPTHKSHHTSCQDSSPKTCTLALLYNQNNLNATLTVYKAYIKSSVPIPGKAGSGLRAILKLGLSFPSSFALGCSGGRDGRGGERSLLLDCSGVGGWTVSKNKIV
jgi:hypothetical protein